MTDAPRRVLMTLDAVGGVWRYGMDLAASLRASGVDIIFVGSGPPPRPNQCEEAEAIGRLEWLDAPLDWMVADEAELDGIPSALQALAYGYHVDLVQLNMPTQAYGLSLSCPIVVASHSCVPTWFEAVRHTEVPPDWAWHVRRNRGGFDRAEAVIVPSRSHGEALSRLYGPMSRLSVVGNAVSDSLAPAEKLPFVLAAGRWWDEGKNGAVLDRAAAHTDWPIRMAGACQGPNGARLVLTHADALGQLPPDELSMLMAQAGILVSPSLYEPFGLTALEGARCEAALVLSDIPTYREIWDDAALFAPTGDALAFAEAINRLAADEDLRRDLGRRAAKRSQRFSLQAQASATLEVYRSAMHRARVPLAASG